MKVTVLGIDSKRDEVVSFVEEKLERVESRFKLTGAEFAVWLRDINGPRGGIDQECSIRLCRSRQAPVVVKCKDDSARVAILGAVARLRRALARRRRVTGA
jgi:putative sigma-54 modulation protein